MPLVIAPPPPTQKPSSAQEVILLYLDFTVPKKTIADSELLFIHDYS